MVRVLNPLRHTLSNMCHDNTPWAYPWHLTHFPCLAGGIECDSNYQILSQGVGNTIPIHDMGWEI